MKFFITTLFFLSVFNSYSQFTVDYLKAADNYFAKGDYYSATQYYEKYLGVKTKGKSPVDGSFNPYTLQTKGKKGGGNTVLSTKEQAVYQLAESYRNLNFPGKAEPAYKEVLNNGTSKFPLAQYYYAITLRSLQKYEEAEQNFNAFLATYTTDDIYRSAAQKEINNLKFIQQQLAKKDIATYTVNKIAGADNTNGANYASLFYNDKLFFTSTRKADSLAKTNTNRLYEGVYTNGSITGVSKMTMNSLENEQQGVAAITNNGSTIYVTKWNAKEGKKNASIYYSKKQDEKWSDLQPVTGLNEDGFSTQQPHITSDGNLYFASNRPGGKGGFDIYMASVSANGEVSNILNLGDINTGEDEQAPYFHNTTNTLIFSTNGRVGMGGLDFFYSKKNGTSFSTPVNFGYPVNSVKDDLYFSTNAKSKNILENVMISSDRNADCCLELYALNKDRIPKQIKGLVVSCDNKAPIANATVKIMDAQNNIVTTKTTNDEGIYSFTLDEFQALKAVASSQGLVDGTIAIGSPSNEEDIVLSNPDICLEKVFPPPPGEEVVLENIYFEYDEYVLLGESNATLDKLAKNMLEHPEVMIEIGGHTDGNGTEAYNNNLSQKRAESCVKYLIEKGVDAKRLIAKGYGKAKPVESNTNDDGSDNPEGRAKNRRTEFKVIK